MIGALVLGGAMLASVVIVLVARAWIDGRQPGEAPMRALRMGLAALLRRRTEASALPPLRVVPKGRTAGEIAAARERIVGIQDRARAQRDSEAERQRRSGDSAERPGHRPA